MGEELKSRRGRVFMSRGESGGEDCEAWMGELERGDGTAGWYGEGKPKENMGVGEGIVANMVSVHTVYTIIQRYIDKRLMVIPCNVGT
jgi:hypothetical protein